MIVLPRLSLLYSFALTWLGNPYLSGDNTNALPVPGKGVAVPALQGLAKLEVPPGFGPGNKGFADLRLTAWLWHRVWSGRRDSDSRHPPWQGGTLPLSYYRTLWCLGAESNHRHGDFQSPALPTELPRQNGDQEGARTLDLQRDRLAF